MKFDINFWLLFFDKTPDNRRFLIGLSGFYTDGFGVGFCIGCIRRWAFCRSIVFFHSKSLKPLFFIACFQGVRGASSAVFGCFAHLFHPVPLCLYDRKQIAIAHLFATILGGTAMSNETSSATVLSLRDMQELVTVKQVAECLQVSKGTIYNLIKDGQLTAVKVRGNMIRLNRDQVCAHFGL